MISVYFVFKFGYTWVQHNKDQSHIIILQANIYMYMYAAFGGIKAFFSKAIFSNEGVTKFENAVFWGEKSKRAINSLKYDQICTQLVAQLRVEK